MDHHLTVINRKSTTTMESDLASLHRLLSTNVEMMRYWKVSADRK
jgi:hypothetical protein